MKKRGGLTPALAPRMHVITWDVCKYIQSWQLATAASVERVNTTVTVPVVLQPEVYRNAYVRLLSLQHADFFQVRVWPQNTRRLVDGTRFWEWRSDSSRKNTPPTKSLKSRISTYTTVVPCLLVDKQAALVDHSVAIQHLGHRAISLEWIANKRSWIHYEAKSYHTAELILRSIWTTLVSYIAAVLPLLL